MVVELETATPARRAVGTARRAPNKARAAPLETGGADQLPPRWKSEGTLNVSPTFAAPFPCTLR